MNLRHARRGPLLAIILGCLLLLAVAPPVSAQQQPEEPVEQAGDPHADIPAAVAVPTSEIAKQATTVNTRLRELTREAAPDENQVRIEDELPDLFQSIADYREAGVNQDIAAAPSKLLNDADQQWRRFEATLNRWSRDLGDQADHVEGLLTELAHLGETWELTAAEAARNELPPAVQEQIGALRDAIGKANEEVGDRLKRLLTLQNQVSEQRIAVDTVIGQLGDLLVARQDDLFRAIVPPLWNPARAEDGSFALRSDYHATWDRASQGAAEFWREYRSEMAWHLVSIVLLAVVMGLLSHRVAAADDADVGVEAARAILRRPLAASALLSLVLASWMLYADAPLVMHSMIPIAAIPFAIWLAPAFVPPERLRLIYWMLLLATLINCQAVIVEVGLLRQVTLAVIPALGIAGLAVFRRRIAREDPVVWPRISIFALSVGAVAFIATLAAAVLGYLPLGEMLINATVESAYIAFLLLAAYRIIDGLVVLSLQTKTLRQLRVVQNHAVPIRGRILAFVRLASAVVWFASLTNRLSLHEAVFGGLRNWLTTESQIGSLSISMGSVLLFFVVLWLTLLIAKIIRHLLEDDILPRADVPRGRSHAMSMLVNYFIVGIGFMLAMAAAGIRIEQFALIGGALGVGIGFGLQNVVSNFVSGLILVFERPVQVGDTIEVGTLMGTVRRIGIRSSTVRTFDEAEVIVPNSDLISSHVVNWTLSDQLRRMEVKVGVAYGTDPTQVQEILVAVARSNAKVLEYPSPYALFKGFGENSLNFVVRFWTSDFGNWIFVASEVTLGIDAALKETGIRIPFPQRDLHIYSVDPPAPIPDGGRVALPPAAPPVSEPATDEARPLQMDGDE